MLDGQQVATERPESHRVSQAPLGLRGDVELDPEQLDVFAALDAYDLSPIRSYLVKRGVMPSTWVDEAVFEFRRYLAMRCVAQGPIYMISKQVDDVWHASLIHTRMYADLCARTLGQFLHHDPVPAPDPYAAWEYFDSTYRGLFGEPGRLWLMWRPGPG